MRPSDKAIQTPVTLFAWIGGIAISLMMLHVVADVFGRLFFNHPLDGTTEIVSRFYMVIVIFFPLAYVCHHEGHILVELFTKGMSRRRLAGLEFVIGILTVAFVFWFAWETLTEARSAYDVNEQAETADAMMSVWPSRFLLPLGLGLMAVYCIYRAVEDWRIATGRRN